MRIGYRTKVESMNHLPVAPNPEIARPSASHARPALPGRWSAIRRATHSTRDARELYRRAANYLDKIFTGARPAELPVEQPTMFELIINMKAARGISLKVPKSLLLRADRVIE